MRRTACVCLQDLHFLGDFLVILGHELEHEAHRPLPSERVSEIPGRLLAFAPLFCQTRAVPEVL